MFIIAETNTDMKVNIARYLSRIEGKIFYIKLANLNFNKLHSKGVSSYTASLEGYPCKRTFYQSHYF